MQPEITHKCEGKYADTSVSTKRWINEAEILNRITSQVHVAYSLWDAVANRFVFFSDHKCVLGESDTGCFTSQDGVKYFLSKVHPDYSKVVRLMYRQCVFHCKKEAETITDCIFQFDAVYQKSNAENFHLLLQALVVETDQSGSPLLFLISMHDITYLKKENTANLIIATCQQTSLWNYCFDKRMLEPVRTFTCQEKRVLLYLGQKKGSKEIANLLNTSSHTIDTQRRSLLHKTNCVDCTALIAYARMTGILS